MQGHVAPNQRDHVRQLPFHFSWHHGVDLSGNSSPRDGGCSRAVVLADLQAPEVCSRFLRNQHILAVSAPAVIYFLCNTVAMAVVISITEGKSARQVWKESYLWSFSYYMHGAAIAGLISFLNGQIGWPAALLVLPVIYVIHRSYRLYIGKLEDEKLHAQQMSNIHLRTVEALALAIEAKDHTTHDHLQRVRVYAMEVAKELVLAKTKPRRYELRLFSTILGSSLFQNISFPSPEDSLPKNLRR
jgi:hypothetical protein